MHPRIDTIIPEAELHPGRNPHNPPIVCCLCNWTPPPEELGGVRWKLLAKHYEQHIDELTAPAKP